MYTMTSNAALGMLHRYLIRFYIKVFVKKLQEKYVID
jgi:hypothetical protein